MRTLFRSVAVVTLVSALVLATGYTVLAASQTGSPDPISALLAEVRALRIAMEQTATVTPRVQLTVARLNIEEQRIAHLMTELSSVQRELASVMLEVQKLADHRTEVEKMLQTESSDEKRKEALGYELEDVKHRTAALSRTEQMLRSRETETSQAVATEQARWIDLNGRLDELERLLAPVRR